MGKMAAWTSCRRSFCVLIGLGFALTFSQSCSRSEPLASDAPSPDRGLPFHSEAGEATGGGTISIPESGSTATVPFRSLPGRTLASGTLLTVQLQDSLASSKVHPGDAFSAFVAAPLRGEDGDALIPRGAPVTGRIESAQSYRGRSGLLPASGYIRLSLNGITLSGKSIPVQTSSLFARGTFRRSDGVRISKGRDLTFRLTAPLILDENATLAGHPQANPTTN
jgi:hypothetical protein